MSQILYFYLYSFLGWVCECLYCGIPARKFINRGFLAGPYCPIYGCGALAVLHVLLPFAGNPPLLFLTGIVLTSALEYATSYVMEKLFHSKWWDYSGHRFNLHGRICLLNSFLFGVLSLLAVYLVHPLMTDAVSLIPPLFQKGLVLILSALFLWDMIHTVRVILRENLDYRMLKENLRDLSNEFKNLPILQPEGALGQKLQALLRQAERDEGLREALERLLTRHHQRLNSFTHTRRRLHLAFPKRLEMMPFGSKDLKKILEDFRSRSGSQEKE